MAHRSESFYSGSAGFHSRTNHLSGSYEVGGGTRKLEALCALFGALALTLQSSGTATSCACGSLRFAPAAPHFHVGRQLI